MMFFKNCKIIKKTTISIVFIVIMLISIYIIYQANRNNMQKEAYYYGSNYSYSITFTRFMDFKSFLNAKSPDILVYDSEDEFNVNTGFIAGEIQIQDSDQNQGKNINLFQSCKLELIRKSGWNTSSTTMNFDQSNDGVTKIPFIAYDFDDSEGNIYNSAILKIGKDEIPIELKIKSNSK